MACLEGVSSDFYIGEKDTKKHRFIRENASFRLNFFNACASGRSSNACQLLLRIRRRPGGIKRECPSSARSSAATWSTRARHPRWRSRRAGAKGGHRARTRRQYTRQKQLDGWHQGSRRSVARRTRLGEKVGERFSRRSFRFQTWHSAWTSRTRRFSWRGGQ